MARVPGLETRSSQAAAFSAIIKVGALVLPLVIIGITPASTTRSPRTPRTRRCESVGHVLQESGDLLTQQGQILLDRVPDDFQVHVDVIVHDRVPHAAHEAPRDLGMGCDEIGRDLLQLGDRLTDHHQRSDDCILRLLVLLKPDQAARMGRVSAGAIKKVRRSAVLRSPFREVVHAGKSFEVRILRPQLCIRTPCSGEDDAVGQRQAVSRTGHSRLQRQRCIHVDHSSLLHQSDAAPSSRCCSTRLNTSSTVIDGTSSDPVSSIAAANASAPGSRPGTWETR